MPPRRTPENRVRRRLLFCGLLLAGLVVVVFAVWPAVRAHMQAVAILKILGGQPVPSLVSPTMGAPLTTEEIDFTVPTDNGGSQTVRAREYLPSGMMGAPALIVLH